MLVLLANGLHLKSFLCHTARADLGLLYRAGCDLPHRGTIPQQALGACSKGVWVMFGTASNFLVLYNVTGQAPHAVTLLMSAELPWGYTCPEVFWRYEVGPAYYSTLHHTVACVLFSAAALWLLLLLL